MRDVTAVQVRGCKGLAKAAGQAEVWLCTLKTIGPFRACKVKHMSSGLSRDQTAERLWGGHTREKREQVQVAAGAEVRGPSNDTGFAKKTAVPETVPAC